MHTFYTLSYLSKKIICKFYLPCAMLVLYDFKRTGVYMMKTKKTIFSYKLTCSLLAFFLFFCSFSFVGLGKGTLDALARRGRIDRRVNGIGHSLPPLLGNQADDTHQCSGDDKQDNAHAKQSRAVQARGITHIERNLTRER